MQMPENCFFARFNQGNVPKVLTGAWRSHAVVFSYSVLPNVETQKVKSRWFSCIRFQGMSDARFTGLEFQPHLTEPCFNQFLTSLHHPQVLVKNHKVVAISNDLEIFIEDELLSPNFSICKFFDVGFRSM
jgi:hypothetical protein